jgi:VCBS repeat-containing protein
VAGGIDVPRHPGSLHARFAVALLTALGLALWLAPSSLAAGTYAGASQDGSKVFFTTTERLVAADVDGSPDIYERSGGTTTLVSAGQINGNGNLNATFSGASADGSKVFFSTGEQLVSADTDSFTDIYERSGGTTTRVSAGQINGSGAFTASFSGASTDGTRVFFTTTEQLVSADTDTSTDVYERSGGATTLASAGQIGGNGAFSVSSVRVSADGSRVFFMTSEQLASGDTDASADVYQRSGGVTTWITQGQINGNTVNVPFYTINTDGSRVYFNTPEQLVPGDTDSFDDVYERSGGVTTWHSPGGNGTSAVLWWGNSEDGSKVFVQTTDRLTAADTDSAQDVYEHSGGTMTLASAGQTGGNGAFTASYGGNSTDGSKLLFTTAEQLVSSDTDSVTDLYERSGGTTTLLSAGAIGGNGPFGVGFTVFTNGVHASMTDDGSRAFFTTAEQLVSADTDSATDVYERSGGTTTLVSAGQINGNGANTATYSGASTDGSKVFFSSSEALTGGDTDGATDVFERSGGATTRVSRLTSDAEDDRTVVRQDSTARAIDVRANDDDGGVATIASATDPAHGTVVLTGGSAGARTGLTYQPDPGYCNNPPPSGPDTFTYALSTGSTATVSVIVLCDSANSPLALGTSHTCALVSGGGVKCWGLGSQGALGYGNTTTIGDNETPGSVGLVNLGAGRTATAIASGGQHTCALLDDGTVRCWGVNTHGALGYGNTATIGDNETPAAAGPVNLGPGRTATAITAGGDSTHGEFTCAILDDGTVRCWGQGGFYELGNGSFNTIGDDETPNTAPAVTFGSSAAVAIRSGMGQTCVLLTDSTTRCWGWTEFGQAGYGTTTAVTTPGPGVNLGSGRTGVGLGSGLEHTCARLDNGDVRCWGHNLNGQLGYGNTTDIGDNETPNAAGPVSLGTGRSATWLSGSSVANHTCAVLDDGNVRCWGLNTSGQLGYGNTTQIGDNELPSTAGPVDLGLGRSAVTVMAGSAHTCAELDNGRITCWGAAASGQLGYGNTTPIGDNEAPGSVGPVDIESPVAIGDSASKAEDSAATAIDVLANDTDADGGPKTITARTQPAHGTVVITGGGTGLTYQPTANYCNSAPPSSTDNFTYTLNGGSTATVAVTVTCVDDNPVGVDDSATVAEDANATAIDVLANDTDIDGGPKTIASATQPTNGTVTLTGGTTGAWTGLTYKPNANYCNGGAPTDSFTYTLNGGSTPTVRVTVTCVDDSPVAVNDSATTAEDSGATAIDVLANDTDVDGGPKSISSATQPANGTVVLTGPAGARTGLTYQPNADYCNSAPPSSTDDFTYMLNGGSTATVAVAVSCVDDDPVAVEDAATVTEDAGATSIDVLGNDTDVDGGELSISSANQPANGTVVLTGGTAGAYTGLTYQPNANYCNTAVPGSADGFTYTLNGGSTARVLVTVTCVDDDPVALDDSATKGEDSGATAIDVLANDTDVDGGPKTISSASDPANGTVTLTGGTSGAHTGLVYAPDANYCNGGGPTDDFTYTLNGGSQALVSVAVTCVDDRPVAVDDAPAVSEDAAAAAIDVLSNDTDIDGGPKTISSSAQPSHGTVVLTGGTAGARTGLTYQPNANYCNSAPPSSTDDFTYTLNGGSTATVRATVTCVDDSPVAVSDSTTVTEDADATSINVLGNDTDLDDGPKSISSATQPANGTVVLTGGSAGARTGLTYQPNANYCNDPPSPPADTFDYTLNGGSTATVSVTVTCDDDAPVGVDDTKTVTEDDNAVSIDVLANDTDVDGGPKTIASATQPAHGTVTLTGGSPGAYTGLTYRPNANYCNGGGPTDDFTYTLNGGSTPTVRVTVTCVDDNPVAVNDSATVNRGSGPTAIDVLANDTDVDGGPKTISSATQPANGTVVLTGGSAGARTGLTYQPSAIYCNNPPTVPADTFTYTLNGGSTATVSVTVTCVDLPPVAQNDTATKVEDSGATAIDVLANDLNPDGGPLNIASATQPAHGTVVLTGGSSGAHTGLTYASNANYCNGGSPTDDFTYTVNGGSSATVAVTVNCVDDGPVAVDDTKTVTEDDSATAIDVLANDTDVDGGPKTISSATQPSNGTVVLTGGSPGAHTGLTYKPNANYCNTAAPTSTDNFTYTVNGGSTGTVRATVTCVDDNPVAVNDSATKAEDSGATAIDVLANDTDIDSGPKTISSSTQPVNGSVVLTGPAGARTGLTYQPNANYCNTAAPTSTDDFTYTLNGGSTATVSVTVTCVDDAPVGVDDTKTVTEDDNAVAIDVLGNDTDIDGGPKTIASATQPTHGTVTLTGGTTGAWTGLTYKPNSNYCNGGRPTDDFTYTLNGGSTPTVRVTVTCVDDQPVAVNDPKTVTEDADATAIDVLANDQDVESDAITISSATQPAKGTVALTGGTSGAHTGLTYKPNANYCNSAPPSSTDDFTYTVNGGSTATVAVTVSCVDDNPVAVNDSATKAEDSGATAIDVLGNDTDVDGGPKAISASSQPANGTVVLTGGTDGARTGLTYEPNANYCNDGAAPDDTFTYTLNGGSKATVSVAVTCVDDNPVAVNDSATKAEDSGATAIDVLGNDTDVDGGPKTISSASDPANGTVVLAGGTSGAHTGLTYAPDANYCNDGPAPDDTFTYMLNGGSQATVSVAVTCVDDNPVAVNDSATKSEDSDATAIDVLANDTDIDAGPKTISTSSQPANGTVVLTGGTDGARTGLTYEPNANYCNDGAAPDDTFTYTLNGGSEATVSVAVTCSDDAPVGVDDTATVAEDGNAITIDVLDNDTDIDGGPKTIASATPPSNGTVTLQGGSPGAYTSLTYRPTADYCNDGGPTDTFTYTLNGGSSPTVRVTVTCVDDAPTATDDAKAVAEDDDAIAIDVLRNDSNADGGPLSIASVEQPDNGSVVLTGGSAGAHTGLTYKPNADYCNDGSPTDDFTYTLNGGSTAIVTVTVTCVDDHPVAVNDSATKAEDSGATAIDVLANDTDVDAGPKTIASVTQPANGTVALTGGSSGAHTGLTYVPDADYCNSAPPASTDDFTYTLNGGGIATVAVTVTCADDAPTGVDDTATVTEDAGAVSINVLGNDTDIDGGPKTIASATQPAHGTVELTGGSPGAHTGLTFSPDPDFCDETAPDTFTYTLNGGSTPTVKVTVTCVDDSPVAVNDAATKGEDSGATAIDVLGNDTDMDAGTRAIDSVTQPDNGTVVVTGGGSGLTYAPNANYCNGGGPTDDFTYTLNGGSHATVSVTVTCVNDAPSAGAGGPYPISEGDSVSLNASATDADTPAADLTYTWDVDGDGSYGDAAGASPTLTWAQLNALGIDDGPGAASVRVKVSDGTDTTTSAPAGLTVTNRAPALTISGPDSPKANEPSTWSFTATDPAAPDTAAGFTYRIDWNGDGTIDQIHIGGASEPVSHTFTAPGSPTIRATVVDKDAGESASQSKPLDVAAGQVAGIVAISKACAEDQSEARTLLGTSKNDSLTGTDKADLIVGARGNDTISGLGGGDCLWGGRGGDSIDGGAGADTVLGRNGNDRIDTSSPEKDVVNCGSGRDRVIASANDDLRACEKARTR